ncbi:MAG: hypothetical protein JWM19_24 [Actinomycetia bacterium]|nr:hypothetical protein [Actinomycetes bacterium]
MTKGMATAMMGAAAVMTGNQRGMSAMPLLSVTVVF